MFNLFDVDWISPLVLLISSRDLCLTFCKNLFSVFRFLGLSSYVFQYWSPGVLSSFSCSSTDFSFVNSCMGLLPVVKSITSTGVVFTEPVISLRAWF